jgi:hypothetical protein
MEIDLIDDMVDIDGPEFRWDQIEHFYMAFWNVDWTTEINVFIDNFKFHLSPGAETIYAALTADYITATLTTEDTQ